jgi:hypothetical protein
MVSRFCETCRTRFEAKSTRARFCTDRCRKRAQRGGAAPAKKAAPRKSRAMSGFEKATLAELRKLGAVDTMLGQQALTIAKRMAGETETGSAVATLSREHSRLMAELAARKVAAADPVNEVQRRRDEKLARARASAG